MFHFTGPYEYYNPPSKYISQEPTYHEHPYHQPVYKKPGFLENLESTIFSKLGINRQAIQVSPTVIAIFSAVATFAVGIAIGIGKFFLISKIEMGGYTYSRGYVYSRL